MLVEIVFGGPASISIRRVFQPKERRMRSLENGLVSLAVQLSRSPVRPPAAWLHGAGGFAIPGFRFLASGPLPRCLFAIVYFYFLEALLKLHVLSERRFLSCPQMTIHAVELQ